MANRFTSTYLIAELKRRGWIPASNTGLSTADALALLNEEQLYITALLKQAREEYLINEQNYDVTLVAGQAQYRVPSRCVASALRSVSILDSQGAPIPLDRIEPERRHLYPGTGSPVGFLLRGNVLEILPAPAGAGTLRIGFLQRPSQVVAEAECGLITVINTGTGQVTVSAAPATFTSSVRYDMVQGSPPFSALAIDKTATVLSNVLTFASIPTGLAVGDYLTLAGETPIPQIPEECHRLLTQRVAYVIAEATSSARLDATKLKLDEMRADVLRLLTPRVTGAARPIINPNGPGMRRGRR